MLGKCCCTKVYSLITMRMMVVVLSSIMEARRLPIPVLLSRDVWPHMTNIKMRSMMYRMTVTMQRIWHSMNQAAKKDLWSCVYIANRTCHLGLDSIWKCLTCIGNHGDKTVKRFLILVRQYGYIESAPWRTIAEAKFLVQSSAAITRFWGSKKSISS